MIPTKEEWDYALEQRHGKKLQKSFSSATVAICGLGGLGSNIAICLARAGVGKLILIDFDRVDITNIHRQQYKATQIGQSKTEALSENLKEISPYISLKTYTEKITEENAKTFLSDADIVCEAFDDSEEKSKLAEFVLTKMKDKYYVAASGMSGFYSANRIRTRKITDKFYLCGDGKSDVSKNIGLVSSRVMVCAAHQAHITLKIISKQF